MSVGNFIHGEGYTYVSLALTGTTIRLSGANPQTSALLDSNTLYVITPAIDCRVICGTTASLSASAGDQLILKGDSKFHFVQTGKNDRISVRADASSTVDVTIYRAEQ
jgi:siroheme synthase